jgi:ribosome-binding protein aMBF1 (putative translation factor)
MYPNLKLQIFKCGIRQNHLAKDLQIREGVLSRIIHGYLEPSPTQRKLLASYLSCEEDWLFEKYDISAVPIRTISSRRNGNDGDS